MAEANFVGRNQERKINTFIGEKDKETTIGKFVEQIEEAKAVLKWDDEQTAAYAIGHMKGPAELFLNRLKMDQDTANIGRKWSTLKPAMIERYTRKMTEVAKTDKLKNIKIEPNETLYTFADRCEIALRINDLDVPDDVKEENAYTVLFKRTLNKTFLMGIPLDVRTYLSTHFDNSDMKTKIEEGEKFFDIKEIKGKRREAQVDEFADYNTQTEEDNIDEIKPWQKGNKPPNQRGRGRGRGRAGAQNRGGGRGARGNYQGAQGGTQGAANTILCYNCWYYGNHMAYNCPNQRREKPQNLATGPNRGRGYQGGNPRGNGPRQYNQQRGPNVAEVNQDPNQQWYNAQYTTPSEQNDLSYIQQYLKNRNKDQNNDQEEGNWYDDESEDDTKTKYNLN